MKYHLEGLVLKLSDPFEGPIILIHSHMRVASIYLSNVKFRRQETGPKNKERPRLVERTVKNPAYSNCWNLHDMCLLFLFAMQIHCEQKSIGI